MNTGIVVKTSFVVGYIFSIFGALQKILHANGADNFLMIGIIAIFTFIITAIYEVRVSKRINSNEKTMWTIGLLFISGIVGFVYIISGRKKVVAISKT